MIFIHVDAFCMSFHMICRSGPRRDGAPSRQKLSVVLLASRERQKATWNPFDTYLERPMSSSLQILLSYSSFNTKKRLLGLLKGLVGRSTPGPPRGQARALSPTHDGALDEQPPVRRGPPKRHREHLKRRLALDRTLLNYLYTILLKERKHRM